MGPLRSPPEVMGHKEQTFIRDLILILTLIQCSKSMRLDKCDEDLQNFAVMEPGDFRVLESVEQGHRNHELVPMSLIAKISNLPEGKTWRYVDHCLKYNLVHRDSWLGYKLTYLGYDYLALRALVKRGVIEGIGNRIGVGKEADVHEAASKDGTMVAVKLHRLGRTSSIKFPKLERDYLQHRTHASHMYMSRLAATKEYEYMQCLADRKFPVPTPISHNRHVVVMSYIHGVPIVRVRKFKDIEKVIERIIEMTVKFARAGIIHGDFNEWNLMMSEEEHVFAIDFPQIISTSHRNAAYYFDRDVECVRRYFWKKHGIEITEYPRLRDVVQDMRLEVRGLKEEDDELLMNEFEMQRDGGADVSESGSDLDEDEKDQDDEGFVDPPRIREVWPTNNISCEDIREEFEKDLCDYEKMQLRGIEEMVVTEKWHPQQTESYKQGERKNGYYQYLPDWCWGPSKGDEASSNYTGGPVGSSAEDDKGDDDSDHSNHLQGHPPHEDEDAYPQAIEIAPNSKMSRTRRQRLPCMDEPLIPVNTQHRGVPSFIHGPVGSEKGVVVKDHEDKPLYSQGNVRKVKLSYWQQLAKSIQNEDQHDSSSDAGKESDSAFLISAKNVRIGKFSIHFQYFIPLMCALNSFMLVAIGLKKVHHKRARILQEVLVHS